jgi:hypothetical protein
MLCDWKNEPPLRVHYIYVAATARMFGMKVGLRRLCRKWLIRRFSQKRVRSLWHALCRGPIWPH